jgi:hypothetical protein
MDTTTCTFAACDNPGTVRARFARPCGHGNHYMNPGPPVINSICPGHAEANCDPNGGRPTHCATCGEVNRVIVTPLQPERISK